MRPVRNWVELLGVIGLFIGIGLVILQLRQNEELLRFQIAADLRVNQDNNRSAVRGEQFSRTVAKLQSAPGEMTDAELLEFDAHAWSIVSELDFRRTLAEVGIFKGDWKSWLQSETCILFDNPVGRTWLTVQQPEEDQMMDPEMLGELDRRMAACASQPSLLESLRDNQAQQR